MRIGTRITIASLAVAATACGLVVEEETTPPTRLGKPIRVWRC